MSLAESLSFRRCAALGSSLDSSKLLLPEKMSCDQGGNGQCLGSESAHPVAETKVALGFSFYPTTTHLSHRALLVVWKPLEDATPFLLPSCGG